MSGVSRFVFGAAPMTKHESRMAKECRNNEFEIRYSDLFRHSSFGFRDL